MNYPGVIIPTTLIQGLIDLIWVAGDFDPIDKPLFESGMTLESVGRILLQKAQEIKK